MRPLEDLLSKAEQLVAEKEGRITGLSNWIEILESEGYEALAARSRELLAMLQRSLATSQDNLRLVLKARALESEPPVFLFIHPGRRNPPPAARRPRSDALARTDGRDARGGVPDLIG